MCRLLSHFLLISAIWLVACSQPKSKNEKSEKPNNTYTNEELKVSTEKKVILFFGNSITAGYGIDIDQAFPAIIQERLDSLGLEYQVVNAGLSGETTAGGKNRIEWVLRTVPEIFMLELGGNDGLRGLSLEESVKNLQEIVDAVKKVNSDAKIIIAGMMVPPNLGQDYTKEFVNIFPKVAKANDAILIPFLLEGVGGEPELNLPDGIHPTPAGHKIVAETVWEYLKPLIEEENNQ